MGIRPIPKSKEMLNIIFALSQDGKPPSKVSAMRTILKAKYNAIRSPIQGSNPIMPAQPILNPQILNWRSSL